MQTFVNLAASLDDGEARCGAIASHRNLIVATDEKTAIKLFSGLNLSVSTISTLEILYNWSQNKNASAEKIRLVLKLIEERASYRPSSSHKYFNWWEKYI